MGFLRIAVNVDSGANRYFIRVRICHVDGFAVSIRNFDDRVGRPSTIQLTHNEKLPTIAVEGFLDFRKRNSKASSVFFFIVLQQITIHRKKLLIHAQVLSNSFHVPIVRIKQLELVISNPHYTKNMTVESDGWCDVAHISQIFTDLVTERCYARLEVREGTSGYQV